MGAKTGYPTEKPVKLMSRILSFFPNLPVLDPFAGSGSTLFAAQADGRKAIGGELEKRYCEYFPAAAERPISGESTSGIRTPARSSAC